MPHTRCDLLCAPADDAHAAGLALVELRGERRHQRRNVWDRHYMHK